MFAHQRIGAIVLDLVWKLIWLILAGSFLGLVLLWVYSQLGSIEIYAPVQAFRNPIALAILGRQLWARYAATVYWMAGTAVIVLFLAWVCLESYFRAGTMLSIDTPFFAGASRNFKVFLASSLLKQSVIAAFSLLMGVIVFEDYLKTPVVEWRSFWPESRAAVLVAVVLVAVSWFVLTIFETAIRADALELVGTDLFAVVGLIGTLVCFEGTIICSAAGMLIILMSLVSGLRGFLLLLATAFAAAAFLTILHSYLIVVRYCALHVLRRTTLVPQGAGIIEHVEEFRDNSHPGFWFPIHPVDRPPHS